MSFSCRHQEEECHHTPSKDQPYLHPGPRCTPNDRAGLSDLSAQVCSNTFAYRRTHAGRGGLCCALCFLMRLSTHIC